MKSKELNVESRYRLLFIITGAVLAFGVIGCEDKQRSIESLMAVEHERAQLEKQLEQSQVRVEELEEQVQTLSTLKAEGKIDSLYDLQSVGIGRYTNLYDRDEDGKKEKLIVYLQPLDKDGDARKAVGQVEVELWDLDKANGQAMLGQWQVSSEELSKLWFATVLTINYRLTFDVGQILEQFKSPLTVKVRFTDYASGKVFKEQKVIKP
ncbi:hypothetical protein ACFL3G_04345 [Planctomycetota bacterium]